MPAYSVHCQTSTASARSPWAVPDPNCRRRLSPWISLHCSGRIVINISLAVVRAVVTPTILFGLATLPMTQTQVVRLDALQRRMLRSIVGWVRVEGEDWRLTMSRMRDRIKAALLCQPVEPWSKQLAKKQHGLATKIAKDKGWPQHVLRWCPQENWRQNFASQPRRKPGRPPKKWTDNLTKFCNRDFPQYASWLDAARCSEWPGVANAFFVYYVNG